MGLLLAIDTSGRTAGAALLDGEELLMEITWRAAGNHTTRLLPAVQHVLAAAGRRPADLTAIAVATGPGAFSGLRVGIACAKALAWARKIPCVGVGSLDALAAAGPPATRVLAVLDAGRGDWYWATYAPGVGQRRRLTEPGVDHPDRVLASLNRSVALVGETSAEQRALIKARYNRLVALGDERLPAIRPGAVGLIAHSRLAEGITDDPATLQPCYIRRPAAEERRLAAT